MDVTTRVLAYLPTGRNPRDSKAFAATADGARRLGLSVLRRRPYLLACDSVQADPADTEQDRLILDIFEGTAASGRSFEGNGKGPDWPLWHSVAEREAQFYNLIEATSESLRIESDPMGMKPLYRASLRDGTVLATRIIDILSLFPALIQPLDRLGFYELMVYRAPMADRTLHQQIKRSATGDCYRWDPANGLSVARDRRLAIPAVNGTLFLDEALGRIKEALTGSMARRVAGAAPPLSLALSGGFDSRLLAATAVEMGLPCRALSYGRRYHPELNSAKATAKALGLPLTRLSYPTENSLERLALHLETVEGTADLSTSQAANLFRIPSRRGNPVLHGFMGEVLSGHRLRHLPVRDYETLGSVADGLVRSFEGPLPAIFERLFGRPAPRDELRAEIRRDLVEGCEPYQAAILWELENRQRRYVGSQFPVIGTQFDLIAPFYSRNAFETWLAIPPIGLDRRALLRRLFATYYPSLAQIPHSEETYPIIPSLSRQLTVFAQALPHKFASRFIPAGMRRALHIPGAEDRYIWNLANLSGPRERAHMLSRIEALTPVAEEILDLRISGGFLHPIQGKDELQPLRMLFLVGEYAAWLRDRVAPAGHR